MKKIVRTLLGLCFMFCLAQTAFSATYTVTKVADTNDGTCDADCSLREAVTAASATPDNDTIVFSALFNSAQTITLSGTDIIINSNGTLTINGPGANLLTISGNNASRIFTNNMGAITTISNLRLTGGNAASSIQTGRAGAAYNNGGTLTLMNLIITGNTAANGGGLNNSGTTASPGTVTIINTTVSNNTATGAGGAMQNFSGHTTNILNSTISGNTSNSTITGGGAIQANGTVNITNSTFSGNNAQGGSGGAIYYNGQGLTMNNVTIAFNRSTDDAGGLHKSTTTLNAFLRNNLIANNMGGPSPDVTGAISSLGNNLIGVVGTSTGWIASDILNRPAFIGPLANNGGPTQTHALLPNSPAINAGQNCVVTATCSSNNPPNPLTTDQRGTGFPRQVGANVDIGAVESPFQVPSSGNQFDFDGDGRTDYAVFRPSNNTWYIQRSTAGFYAAQFGLSTDRLTPADYDGDGRTDIAVYRDNVANSRSFFYILNSSNNTFRAEQFGAVGDDPSAVGDWDGDGKADLAVRRSFPSIPGTPTPSVFYYRPSSAPGTNFIGIQWGNTGDKLVRGDFDGDGKQDAAVFRLSDRIWYILQSSNNQPRYQFWGLPDDKLVPADYDGDGKTDFAIFRNGLWAILQSSNNQQRYQIFGNPSDTLVPGDYDGDGKADIAVWRDGIFYVLRSSNNQLETFRFGAPGDIPVASAYIQ